MKKMKEKWSGRDRNEKVKIAQSNNSIFGGHADLSQDRSYGPAN